jgi:hypothetical protein
MEQKDETTRVWVGRDLLQAQFMRQVLLDNGIESLYTEHNAVGYEAGIYDYGLWVQNEEAARARALLAKAEEDMSAALDADTEPADEQG